MEKIFDGKHTFEIVNSIPKGYKIWNIGSEVTKGYIPLCQTIGEYDVNVETLKAVKCEDTEDIMYSSTFGQGTVKKMNTYIKRYSKSKNTWTLRRVERMKKAVEVLSTIKGYENLEK